MANTPNGQHNWGTTTIRELRRLARPYSDMTSAFAWLKRVGLVPEDVVRMDVVQVRTELDPENVEIRYVAASAFEWDTWGPASPDAFVNAIAAESRGAKRDIIVETLTSLGSQVQEVVA